jgi:hypothetical protein
MGQLQFLQRAKMRISQPVNQKGTDRSGEEKVDPQAGCKNIPAAEAAPNKALSRMPRGVLSPGVKERVRWQ